jgi:phosphoenolpyruvate carboxylase
MHSLRRTHSSMVPSSKFLLDRTCQATPETEYGRMNIGSRPAKRKPKGGIESLRAIPWIFSWTQTRFHLPVWLGVGAAFQSAIKKDSKNIQKLKEMYNEWPFFRVTIDLLEMVFAKGDPSIAGLYDELLVADDLKPFGEQLRNKYLETQQFLLQVLILLKQTKKKILKNSQHFHMKLDAR